jgi:YD repeat-containing protein
MGRLIGTTTSYSFLTGRNFTTSYSYDKASNRTGFTDPESGSTTYAYGTGCGLYLEPAKINGTASPR